MASKRAAHIVIVGGGIAGLCAAIVVLSLGKSVAIYERSLGVVQRDEGAGIVVGDDLLSFVQRFNITSAAWTVTSDLRQTLDRTGDQIDTEARVQHLSSWKILYTLLRSKADSLAMSKQYYFDGTTVVGFRRVEKFGIEIELASSAQKETRVTLADMLLGADGANSFVRRVLAPAISRQPVGYVAWRGVIPESELSVATRDALLGRLTFFHGAGTQMVVYTIPSSLQTPSEKLLNFVWYCNCEHTSAKYKTIMTDVNGVVRHITMPLGLLKPEVWSEEMNLATRILPPVLAELVVKTKIPFVQGITDVLSPKAVWLDGRVVLVGDALAGFRPHTGASTNQAALHALSLWDWLKLPKSNQDKVHHFEERVMEYAEKMIHVGQELGLECQVPIDDSSSS